MNLLQEFQRHIKVTGLFHPTDGLLIAVSGGIDSVVLTYLCHASGYHISLAHMNFGLRGEESDRDEKFIRGLADRLSVPLFVKRAETLAYAAENKISIQETARILRYAWFRELMQRDPSLAYLCTAHHADDNVETVLMNLFRGTGISGLRGIQPKQDNIVRPLLFAGRENIEQYALRQQLAFVEDSSNKEEKYTRNFFRLQVIPLIEKVYPSAAENMRHNISRFTGVEILYREMVDLKRKILVSLHEGAWHIPVEKLRYTSPLPTIVYELFSPFGFSASQIPEVIGLMDSPTGKCLFSSTHRLLKNRNWFIITPLQVNSETVVVIPGPAHETSFSEGKIVFTGKSILPGQTLDPDPLTACVDTNVLVYPMIIRKWRAGDYFYPLGMRKKKKLSRFFIDNKIPQHEKENTWVLESGGKIIWVIGQRIDDRFKVQAHTTKMTCMRWQKNS
jgi:tRNA(Ile)-lysidine synthase